MSRTLTASRSALKAALSSRPSLERSVSATGSPCVADAPGCTAFGPVFCAALSERAPSWRVELRGRGQFHRVAARCVIGKTDDCRKSTGKEEASDGCGRQPRDCPAGCARPSDSRQTLCAVLPRDAQPRPPSSFVCRFIDIHSSACPENSLAATWCWTYCRGCTWVQGQARRRFLPEAANAHGREPAHTSARKWDDNTQLLNSAGGECSGHDAAILRASRSLACRSPQPGQLPALLRRIAASPQVHSSRPVGRLHSRGREDAPRASVGRRSVVPRSAGTDRRPAFRNR